MAPPKKIFMLAGEPSGDTVGADLLRQIAKKIDLHAIGVGGPKMQATGMVSNFPMSDLSVMGFVDVLRRLPLLFKRIDQTVAYILAEQPDLVVFIDSQVFSAKVARALRAKGYKGPILLYVAPSVWAWKPERAPRLAEIYDEILAVLPFEPQVMAQLKGPKTYYVGHPAVDEFANVRQSQTESGKLILLPGSRTGEIRRHMELFKHMAEELADHPAITGFILPTLPHLTAKLIEQTAQWNVPVEVVTGAEEKIRAFSQAHIALASAGTVSLELALAGIPLVGVYVPDWGQVIAYEKAGRPKLALPNIILSRDVDLPPDIMASPVPEIKTGPDHFQRVQEALRILLDDAEERHKQRAAFARVTHLMTHGMPPNAQEDAVERLLSYLS